MAGEEGRLYPLSGFVSTFVARDLVERWTTWVRPQLQSQAALLHVCAEPPSSLDKESDDRMVICCPHEQVRTSSIIPGAYGRCPLVKRQRYIRLSSARTRRTDRSHRKAKNHMPETSSPAMTSWTSGWSAVATKPTAPPTQTMLKRANSTGPK
jgi:hypothetical protein